MTIIAIDGGIGTFGQEIATRLSNQLGIELCDAPDLEEKLLDRLIADQLVPDMPGPTRVDFSRALHVPVGRWCRLVSDEILERAAYGNVVIRGWGAAALLGRYSHVCRVRITASFEDRMLRLAEHHASASRDQLRQAIESSDAIDEFYLNWFSAGAVATTPFDVNVDTSAASIDDCVASILTFNASKRPSSKGYLRAIVSALANITTSGRAQCEQDESGPRSAQTQSLPRSDEEQEL